MNEVFYLFLLKRNDMVYLYSIHIVSQKASFVYEIIVTRNVLNKKHKVNAPREKLHLRYLVQVKKHDSS